MKKLGIFVLCALAAILIVTGFSACSSCGDSGVTEKCAHSWSRYEVTLEATCETEGENRRVCAKCGETQTKTLPALGHDEITDHEVAPTCVKDGLSEGKHCLRCGKITVKQEILPARGHEYGDFIVEKQPSCTQTGLKYRKCSACGDKTDITEIEKTAHNYGEYYFNDDATCVKNGTKSAKCPTCGKIDTVIAENTALGHLVTEDKGFAATCVSRGLTDGSHCSRCGEILSRGEILPALGHERVQLPFVAPDCVSSGLSTGEKCNRCGKILVEQNTLPALGHDIVRLPSVEATCVSSGLSTGEKCNRCGKTLIEQKTLPALGHNYKVKTVEATCTSDGYTLHECSRCGDNYKSDEVKAHHVWNRETASCGTDKRCTLCGTVAEKATGKHSFVGGICSVCSYACAHDYNIEYKAATCTDSAYKIEACKYCDVRKKTVTGSALGHDGNVVCNRCKTRVLPGNFFSRAIKKAFGSSYTLEITDLKTGAGKNSPVVTAELSRYENANEYLYVKITQPGADYTQTLELKIKRQDGKIYAYCDSTSERDGSVTETGKRVSLVNQKYTLVGDVGEIYGSDLIPTNLRPIVGKILSFASSERADLVFLTQKYPERAEKIAEYVANNVFFCKADGTLIQAEKSNGFALLIAQKTLKSLYESALGEGEWDKTLASLSESEAAEDKNYRDFLVKYADKKLCEIISDRFSKAITGENAQAALDSCFGYDSDSPVVLKSDEKGFMLSVSRIYAYGGSLTFSSGAETEPEIAIGSAIEDVKTRDLTDSEKQKLYRAYSLAYDAEKNAFLLESVFNEISRIVVDPKTDKSYIISLEKYLFAATRGALPTIELTRSDCIGYEEKIFSFKFYGTEGVRAAAYELKNDVRGDRIELSEEDEKRIFAILSEKADNLVKSENQIETERKVRLMRNVETGAFTLIPDNAKTSTVTHHDYELKRVTGEPGCGAAVVYSYECKVCGDAYDVYETVAHSGDYTTSFLFDGEKDCSGGVTVVYSCANCRKEVKRYKTYNHVPFADYIPAQADGACGDHALLRLACPCGKNERYSFVKTDGENCEEEELKFVSTEKTSSSATYSYAFACEKCGLLVVEKITLSGVGLSEKTRKLTVGKGVVAKGSYVFYENYFSVISAS